jgi:hypothetical protein
MLMSALGNLPAPCTLLVLRACACAALSVAPGVFAAAAALSAGVLLAALAVAAAAAFPYGECEWLQETLTVDGV